MKYPILLPNIFDHPFTYESESKLNIGDYVNVPFGSKTITGVVWDKFEENNNKNFKIKSIKERLNILSLKKQTINFLNWFSYYNLIPLGMTLRLHFLSGKAIEMQKKEEYQKYSKKLGKNQFNLSNEQIKAYKEIIKKDDKFRVHLLQGTTGSGKTIVYFNSIKKILDQGKQSLILLPEIGLTGEFEKKFKSFFGFEAAIWHSKITPKMKKIIWSGLASGEIKVVIGARSSLFLPFKNLGLITVDEEHDQSYKQDEGVIYNARDMAIARASNENIPINLITAVPSIETYANVKNEKYYHSRLIKRYKDAKLPNHHIIDLNQYKLAKKSFISSKTLEKVNEHLLKGDQILFFINRRGFAPYVLCKKCLNVFSCPNCSINLVYHKNNKKLLCHYCGYSSNLNRKCKKKDNCEFIFSGPGVEKIAEEVEILFPNKKINIFSSDTMNKASGKKILDKIISGEINILIGTQLISKGFHFPNLNCIVVLDIDLTSQGHDLRSTEKNLQLYHQLSGRAGRAGKPANIYFQTLNLKTEVIDQITHQDPFKFLDHELELRKQNNLPPFERFVSLILTSEDEKLLYDEALKFKNKLVSKISEKILGPVNAPVFRIKRKFRSRLLIRAKKNSNIQKKLKMILKEIKFSKGMKLIVDVDPVSFN
ncbi:primosomal protein N' [Candidatus Pelagibacter sp.]|nr:primosomal protein N' [Candidatus Pelagibacter sp.]